MQADLVTFDLDDTLAPSKSAMPQDVAAALRDLLDVVEVCVISGGRWSQFREQLLAHLPATDAQLTRLHLMPTCGTHYLRHLDGVWRTVYEHPLSADERAGAIAALAEESRALGLWEAQPWGEIIEDRGTQVTFSALGQQAPLDAKRAWDPEGSKRIALARAVAARLPQLEVRAGGSTSVDVTRRGIDKAYGMRSLAERTGIALADMIFVGDRLDPDGNDYPVRALGVRCVEVSGPEETAAVIRGILAKAAVA